ncbi:Hypothetical protein EHI5A_088660 [Entamoeba histolytica KU27]|uniref:Uncharacterized protein n=1 Tax=Entamoeba histolytica KU27 TaxID=885311 RepID=M2S9S3_ENTHI|nr:Hypothetical protein EHI5A_088660 [Entamoeba histolytica KU27]
MIRMSVEEINMTYFYIIGKSDYNLTQYNENCLNHAFIINIGKCHCNSWNRNYVYVSNGEYILCNRFHIVSKVILINVFECSNTFGVKNGDCLKTIVRVITGVIIIGSMLL